MADSLAEFTKQHEYLICVDSDGCAMDTMDIKHIRCFGPCMVDEWELGEWREEILARWNEINLYTMTRGINRFKGLKMALREIDGKYRKIEDLEALENWADTSPELSNDALKKAIDGNNEAGHPHISLEKALSWSNAVNQSISRLAQDERKPFEGVDMALTLAHRQADVVIVSSANLGAVLEEWDLYGLLEHTDVVLAQNIGSKAFCIGEMLKKGYEKDHVLMCGDAPGDLDAAQKNGVFYFPILVKHEAESWAEFTDEAFTRLIEGTYGGGYQEEKIRAFRENLGG
ncbi:MAG: HAD family hydrolase [Lachnospiraceae bacterium]|nr:HAD family hydrolase [Lachnospiraceae bacterium]